MKLITLFFILFSSFLTIAQAPFCLPVFRNDNANHITRVRLTNGATVVLNNTSTTPTNGAGYSDFTSIIGNVPRGSTINFQINSVRNTNSGLRVL